MLYLEDLTIGRHFTTGKVKVTSAMIREFASSYDPQPFHTDPEKAKETFFGSLVASGWHTAALTMRLMVDSKLHIAGGLIGLGLEHVRWPKPVRPGDELSTDIEVIECRLSASRPGEGIVTVEITTKNQNDETVMTMRTRMLAPAKGRR